MILELTYSEWSAVDDALAHAAVSHRSAAAGLIAGAGGLSETIARHQEAAALLDSARAKLRGPLSELEADLLRGRTP